MKLGVITDVHLAPPDHPPARFHNPYDFTETRSRFARALELHRDAGVDAIAMLGDLANAGDEHHHLDGLGLCAGGGLMTWLVPGNHDCEEGVSALPDRVASLGSGSVRLPTAHGESIDGLRVAGLPAVTFDTERHWLTARPELNAWGSETVLLLTHAPVLSRAAAAADAKMNYAGDVTNHEEIAALLRGRAAPTIVLHGHLHLRDAVVDGTILQIGFAAMIEPPHEIATIEIVSNGSAVRVHARHQPIAESSVERLPVLTPATSTWHFVDGVWDRESA